MGRKIKKVDKDRQKKLAKYSKAAKDAIWRGARSGFSVEVWTRAPFIWRVTGWSAMRSRRALTS